MTIDPSIDALLHSAKKRALNEAAFQNTNDILSDKAQELLDETGAKNIAFAFTCECSDLRCVEDVHLTVEAFERISEHKARFCVVASHNQPDIEKVVEKNDTHWIVEKLPGLLRRSDE